MSHVPIPPPTQDELQDIRDSDEAAGEDLRFAPLAWTHRRQLLAYIDATEEQYRVAQRMIEESRKAPVVSETDPPPVDAVGAPTIRYTFTNVMGNIGPGEAI